MKKIIFALITVVLTLVTIVACASVKTASDKAERTTLYENVEANMTKEQVDEILGVEGVIYSENETSSKVYEYYPAGADYFYRCCFSNDDDGIISMSRCTEVGMISGEDCKNMYLEVYNSFTEQYGKPESEYMSETWDSLAEYGVTGTTGYAHASWTDGNFHAYVCYAGEYLQVSYSYTG